MEDFVEEVCPYCSGGLTFILLNPEGYHYHSEEPEISAEYCEECGGTGFTQMGSFSKC